MRRKKESEIVTNLGRRLELQNNQPEPRVITEQPLYTRADRREPKKDRRLVRVEPGHGQSKFTKVPLSRRRSLRRAAEAAAKEARKANR